MSSSFQTNTSNLIEKGKIVRQRRRLEELLPKYEVAIKGCTSGTQDLECGLANSYGEVDLSPNQRVASEINTQPRTALIEESEVVEEGSGEEESTEVPSEAPADAEAPAEAPSEAPAEAPAE